MKMDKFEKKFEQMDKRLDSHENMLAQLIEIVTTTNQRIDYFEKETHKRFDTIELKLNRLEADINLLFQENADQKREINYIKQKVL